MVAYCIRSAGISVMLLHPHTPNKSGMPKGTNKIQVTKQ